MISVATDALVAMAIESDHLRHRAFSLVNDLPAGQGALPTVLAETGYLIDRFSDARAEVAFLRSVEDGALHLVELTTEDVVRMAEIVERHESLRLSATDASVRTGTAPCAGRAERARQAPAGPLLDGPPVLLAALHGRDRSPA